MVNVNKLRGKIVECGLNTSELANLIGIDRTTLYRKFNADGETLTIREADLISKELNLSRDEVNDIFFSQFVAQMRQMSNHDKRKEVRQVKPLKNKKEETTEERLRKARRDTRQAIYIALASIGISLAQIISAFVKAYLQLK